MKRLKVMAALLVILSLVILCVACGNKAVESKGEDGTHDSAQQDTATENKTAAEDKDSLDNVTPAEAGVATDGPMEISGGVEERPTADGDTSSNTKPADTKPNTEPDNKTDSKPDTEPDTKPDTPDASQDLKWEEYYALTPEQQDAYFDSFSDYKEFQKWMKKAREQFKTEHPDIEIGADGSIDLSKLK